MTAEQALKPCPCCRHLASIQQDFLCFSDGRPGWRIACDWCGLQTCWWHSEAEAIAAWNTRLAPEPQEKA